MTIHRLMNKSPDRLQAASMRDLSPVVFRGEPTGTLKPKGGFLKPYFFAESHDQAKLYAGRGTDPLCCVMQGTTALDLTCPNPRNPVHAAIVKELTEAFDDWTCRTSGESRDAWSYLECGDLYDYEGTGSADRWNRFLRIALDAHDAVRVLDCTDGTGGQPSPVWVTTHPETIRPATFGETLAATLHVRPWAEIQRWLERDHGSLLERISRLRLAGDEYRLDQLHQCMPASNMAKVGYAGGHVPVWRALPACGDIRPGDWVALKAGYAQVHVREQDNGVLKSLSRVAPSDVHWAGSDESEFFYFPAAWCVEAGTNEEYLKALTFEQVRMLGDGEEAQISRYSAEIAAVKAHVLSTHDHGACGEFHGPAHWARVSEHAHSVARSLGEDPLVGHIFGWVHDSQRENEDLDPGHGPRAARFIRENRETLFGFLRDDQVKDLAYACELHSDGYTDHVRDTKVNPVVQGCWDADRLDLWRVYIEPSPQYLCTPYAKSAAVIADALAFLNEANGEEVRLEDVYRG